MLAGPSWLARARAYVCTCTCACACVCTAAANRRLVEGIKTPTRKRSLTHAQSRARAPALSGRRRKWNAARAGLWFLLPSVPESTHFISCQLGQQSPGRQRSSGSRGRTPRRYFFSRLCDEATAALAGRKMASVRMVGKVRARLLGSIRAVQCGVRATRPVPLLHQVN